MRIGARRISGAIAAAAFAGVAVAALATSAQAQPKSKSVKTEAEWIEFDATAKTVTVKIVKPGSGSAAKTLKKGKPAVFKVVPEGSVLKRTTVSINGRKGELTDIPAGKAVNVYWVPDAANEQERLARKIDVFLTGEELEERYGVE